MKLSRADLPKLEAWLLAGNMNRSVGKDQALALIELVYQTIRDCVSVCDRLSHQYALMGVTLSDEVKYEARWKAAAACRNALRQMEHEMDTPVSALEDLPPLREVEAMADTDWARTARNIFRWNLETIRARPKPEINFSVVMDKMYRWVSHKTGENEAHIVLAIADLLAKNFEALE